MRRILVTLMLLLITLNTTAQNTDEYRLRKPTAEEYLSTVPQVISLAGEDYFDLRHVIMLEFSIRHGEISLSSLPFELLSEFHRAVAYGADMQTSGYFDEWFFALLEAGFRDYGIHEMSEELTLGELEIESTPVDFNGDGAAEYLLKVFDATSGRTVYTLAIGNLDGDYQFAPVPLPVTGLLDDLVTRGFPETGVLETRQLADINNDGSTEWIVQGGDYGYWQRCGDLYVIDWNDGTLVDVAGDLFSYCVPYERPDTVRVDFRYTQQVQPWGHDILRELEMVEERLDGWNCQQEKLNSLTWIGEEYQLETVTRFADTAWCTLREADLAFYQSDFASATSRYEQALSEYQFSEQMTQYLSARLALAFALNNETEQAAVVLDGVTIRGQMGELVSRLKQALDVGDAGNACQAAHDFFLEINTNAAVIRMNNDDSHFNPYEWTPENYYFGTDWIDPRYYPLPDPQQAGCDIQMFLPEPTPYPTTEDQQAVTTVDMHTLLRWTLPGYLAQRQYDDALDELNRSLAIMSLENEPLDNGILYWQALILDLMDHPDEALAAYLAIIETAPQSAWGMLAALHVQPVGE